MLINDVIILIRECAHEYCNSVPVIQISHSVYCTVSNLISFSAKLANVYKRILRVNPVLLKSAAPNSTLNCNQFISD